MAWGQVAVNNAGIVQTGLPAAQDNLLGPLIPSGNSPWIFGDLAEKGVADNMAPAALANAPALSTALPGTVSWISGNNVVTTTANLTGPFAGKSWVAFSWNSVGGAGTGRALCPISSVTATTITCSENLFEPTSYGVSAYLLPPPNSTGWDFQSWTGENPSLSWNYYDVAIGLYRLYYRTGNTTYQTYARQYADIQWQWVIDHGYRFVAPRAGSVLSQFFRALEGHSERFPGLYNNVSTLVRSWADPSASPAIDNREAGYTLWDVALGAKTVADPTRHAQYCSWLSTYTAIWNSKQSADGSCGENEYALNPSYVRAPESFSAPLVYETVKLDHLDAWNRARERNAALYREALAEFLTTPIQQPYQTGHVYNQFVIRCARRDELRKCLAESGVGTEVYYPLPLHLQPALAAFGHKAGDFPVSEQLSKEVLAVPIFAELTEEEIATVASLIREFYERP